MSDFGDFDPDDALDHEPADPVQVAIRLHRYRRLHENTSLPDWDDLSPEQRDVAVEIVVRLLAWLMRQGALR